MIKQLEMPWQSRALVVVNPRRASYQSADGYEHAIQVMDVVETFRDLSSGLMDLYLSSLSHRMNEVMKVLTVMASIFIPLTFIAGIYGMNFNPDSSELNMPELNWALGYPVAIGVMVFIALVMVAYFKRRGWI